MVISSHQSKDRQHNGQMKKGERTNKDLQNITQKSKDRATQTSQKNRSELGYYGRVDSSCSTYDSRRVTVKQHEHHLTWKSW